MNIAEKNRQVVEMWGRVRWRDDSSLAIEGRADSARRMTNDSAFNYVHVSYLVDAYVFAAFCLCLFSDIPLRLVVACMPLRPLLVRLIL